MTNTKESLTGLRSSCRTLCSCRKPRPLPYPPFLFPPFVVLMNERRPERQPLAEDRRSISGSDERWRWQSTKTLADNLPGEAASDAVVRPRTPELIRLPSASIRGRRWGGKGGVSPLSPHPAGGSGRFTADPLADKETMNRGILLGNVCPRTSAPTPMRP